MGWNFLFIGSTSLLTGTYSVAEKPKPNINDMTVFVVSLICSFSAGALLDLFGWKAMNMALIPWLVIAAASLFWLSQKEKSSLFKFFFNAVCSIAILDFDGPQATHVLKYCKHECPAKYHLSQFDGFLAHRLAFAPKRTIAA